MGESSIKKGRKSKVKYEDLEEVVRLKVQEFIQDILEEEVTDFLCRGKSEGIRGVDIPRVYCNGHGRLWRFALMNGTITLRRPRLRDSEGFESKVLPLFKRRSKELGEALPELYLHGLAKGDFELALRGLLGDGVPLSASSMWH